ncbi:hypothetical protein [uncultured Roseobacter sp.]|uniref:hypothetical protein n=1 Tax=uncultured Roseobacter sp. TaxID=114847 RepID=UPI002608EE18|nr:hypothetical protein [uncultured Roseobacter sp.]
MAILGLAATPLAACQIVGGADYLDTRDQSKVLVVWNSQGTDFFTDCGADRSPIAAPPIEVLQGIAIQGPMSEQKYNRANFYVCPELAEVSQ